MKRLKTTIKLGLCALGVMASAALAQAAEKCTDCITFSADKAFGIKLVKGTNTKTPPPTVNLTYSTDQEDWKTFEVNKDYQAAPDGGGTYKIHIRGTGNKAFAANTGKSGSNVFTSATGSEATAIACSGDVMTLLDYEKVASGEEITMNDYTFANLFNGFTALTSAPEVKTTKIPSNGCNSMFRDCKSLTTAPAELPATELGYYAYGSMFSRCAALTNAPALPATKLSALCYNSMFFQCSSLKAAPPELPGKVLPFKCYFQMFRECLSMTTAPAELPATKMELMCCASMFASCSSLKTIPALPATEMAIQCYSNMFRSCSNLVVNTAYPGKEWKIPSTTPASHWGHEMFRDIKSGSTAPSSPALNTTYYIASAPAMVTPQDVANATWKVYTNGTIEVATPYTVRWGDAVTVTYTADAGYLFAGGKATWATNFTANAETISVTIPASEQPKQAVAEVGGTKYTSINDVFKAVNGQTGNDVTVTILCDITEELTDDYTFTKNVTLTTDVEGGVTVDLGFAYGKDLYGLIEDGGSFVLDEKVTVTGLGQFFAGYDNGGTVDLYGDVTAQQFWAYKGGVFNVHPTAKVVAAYDDGQVKLRYDSTINVEGTGTDEVQFKAGYFSGDKDGAKTLTLSNTYATAGWLTNEGKGSFTLNLDSARFETDDNKGMDFGASSENTINMTADSFISTYKLTNITAINIDATGIEGDVKVIDITGSQAMTLEDFGTVTAIGGAEAYVKDNDLWVKEKLSDCITFSADKAFGIKFVKGADAPTVNLEYSTDQRNWKSVTAETGYDAENDGGTYKIHFRGKGNSKFAVGTQAAKYSTFTSTGGSATAIACSGNIMTLLDYEKVAKGQIPDMNDYAFLYLFRNFNSLTAAPELPATNLTMNCYNGMFAGCVSLTAAPKLPATTLANGCYCSMFSNCRSLTVAPELPATNLANFCYRYLFQGCRSLTAAPELPATTLATSCYEYMFRNCRSLTDVPALDVAVVTNACCNQMFSSCLNLVVNTTGPGKEWKIPSTVEIGGKTAQFGGNNYWATNMFENTAGDVGAGAEIKPGQVYYVGAKKETVGDATLYRYGDQARVDGAGELTKEIADTLKGRGITNLTIGAGVTDIGEGAFSYWGGLKDVTIGDSVTNIADSAFFRCAYVTNLVVGAGVEKVGANAFNRCFSLESFTFGSLAVAEACQDAYKVVTRITMDGKTPVVDTVPDVKVKGYTKTLKGKKHLTDEEWTTIDDPSQIPSELHFFKYEYKAEEH